MPELRCIGRQRLSARQEPIELWRHQKWIVRPHPQEHANPRVGIMLCASVISALALMAVVNQVAIVMCRRAQAPTELDQYEH
jgi:hypothetical protein